MLQRAARYRNCALLKATLLLAVVPLILYAFVSDAPPAHTGGFGEPNCTFCHFGTVNPDDRGKVTIGQPDTYTPGTTVPIMVTIEDSADGRRLWGFQLSARFQNRTQAGNFVGGENVRVQIQQGVQYAAHSPAQTQPNSFTYTVMWMAPPDASGGDIVFNAAGNAADGRLNQTGDRIFTTVAVSQAPPAGAGGIIPQIANSGTPESGGFFMIFNAVNVTNGPATVTVEFFDSQGAPMSMPIVGGEFDNFTATLQPGGYAAQATIPNGSGTRIGYARVTSIPEDSVAVNATFVQLVPARPPFMAGIPATNTLHSTAYMPYVSDGGFTPSLALVSRLAQTVTLTARSGLDGAERCNTTLSFGDGEHRAFLLRDVLPCTATGEGSLEIRGSSSTPALSGIGFLANDEGAFVTQPIWSSTETLTNP